MTDDFASGWPTQDLPSAAEEADDPGPDPGIDFDAILRRLDSPGARPAASPVPSTPAMIPATPPSAWSAGSPARAAEPPADLEAEPYPGRDVPHPVADGVAPTSMTPGEIPRDAIAVAVFPRTRPGEGQSRTSDPGGSSGSSGTGRRDPAGGAAATRPGARSPASSLATPIDRLRLEPPSYDLGVGAPSRPGTGPEAAPAPIPSGGAGAGEDAGFAGSRRGVSPEDLLKTNELLRQLVEETRRFRVASLPAASPSAYPAR